MRPFWLCAVFALAGAVAGEEPRFLASTATGDGLVVLTAGSTNTFVLYKLNEGTLRKSWEQTLPGRLATAEISQGCLCFPPHQPSDFAAVVRAKDPGTGLWQHYWVVSWDRNTATYGRIDGPPKWDSQKMQCVSVCLAGDSLYASFLSDPGDVIEIPTVTYENCCTAVSQVDHDVVGRYHITTQFKTIPDEDGKN